MEKKKRLALDIISGEEEIVPNQANSLKTQLLESKNVLSMLMM